MTISADTEHMSHSALDSKKNAFSLSFQEILQGFSEENQWEIGLQSSRNIEWTSIVENTILLNSLYANELHTPRTPSNRAHLRYAAQTKPSLAVNKTSQQNVPQLQVNPLWNTLTKTAFEKINAPEIISLNHRQQPLPVFYSTLDLKKVYRQRAKILHPDQPSGSHLEFIELKKNYQILMDFLNKID